MFQYLAHALTQIHQQMPPIGYLERLGCTLSRSLRIGSGTITTDHFYTRMCLEPSSERIRLAIRQKIGHPSAFQIDKNCAITQSFFRSLIWMLL